LVARVQQSDSNEDCPVQPSAGNNGQVTSRSDSELLSEYAATGAESAFAQLVERHIGLVYSAALRIVVDQHLAEDVTQTTFALLAREARHLIAHPVLPAWLHRTASNQAAKLVRGEMRRREREQEAHAMEPHTTDTEADWKQIAPLLDSAINELPERDRSVIFMKFFGTKSAREIGAALRVTEEAAQKRVTRAVDRLRGIFARNGVRLSAAALAAAFAANTCAAVPPALSLSVTSSALAGSAAATGLSLSTLKLILMSKLKVSAICALVVAGVVTPLVIQQQRNAKAVAPTAAAPAATDTAQPANAAASPAAISVEEERQRYDAEVARNVNMLKQVGLQLRLSMRDNPDGNINGERVLEAVGAGASGRKPVELLVPNVAELQQIMSRKPETIVARTAEPIRTPDGKWLRVYTLADGSAHQRITDDPAQIFEGNWQRIRVRRQD
jgi:RNA polymerase sigma factor (sigma-70 family)